MSALALVKFFYANIILTNGKAFPIFRYTDLSGKSEFFNQDGRSVNKLLLLTPVNGCIRFLQFWPIAATRFLEIGVCIAARTTQLLRERR